MKKTDIYRAERDKGLTYKQIADKYGVSHQAVSHACGRGNPRYHRVITPKGCIYKNLRRWMNENKVSFSELLRRLGKEFSASSLARLHEQLRGKTELKKSTIDKLIAVSGLRYEILFEKDGEG